MNKLIKISATWGYLGLAPKAPGTVGSLGALPLAYLFMLWTPTQYMVATFLFTFVALIVCVAYENTFQVHDPKEVVIDEVAGVLITLTWLPLTWQSFVLGFVLFRTFDIVKPFPIGLIDQKVKGGVGVLADDVAAGIISNVILQIIYINTPWLGAQLVQ